MSSATWCEGCRPVVVDAATGERLPADAPQMRAALGVWEATTEESGPPCTG
jgi:hypothetical protein